MSPPRIRVTVLVADDLAPDVREAIETMVQAAVDDLLVSRGGELHFAELPDDGTVRGRRGHTISYADPKKRKPS